MRIKITSNKSPIDKLVDSIISKQSHISYSTQYDTLQAQKWLYSSDMIEMLKSETVYRKGDKIYQFVLSLFSIKTISFTALEIKIDYRYSNQSPSIIINGSSDSGMESFKRAVYYMQQCVGVIEFNQFSRNYYNQLINWKNINKFHGDYFRHNCKYSCSTKSYGSQANKFSLSILNFEFRTSFKNEQLFRREVASITTRVIQGCRSEYEKIKTIYKYVVDHVTYDYSLSYYTAYHALIKGTAVCEGISLLLYSMLHQAGVINRIVSGIGKKERHAWNIVRLNGVWYNLDATWDLGKIDFLWQYFLRGSSNFTNHVINANLNEEFKRDGIVVSIYDYEKGLI